MKKLLQFAAFLILIMIFILPLLAPIIIGVASLCLVSKVMSLEFLNGSVSSFVALSFYLFLASLIVEVILSIVGLSPKTQMELLKSNKITAFALEAAINIFSITLGYRIIFDFNMTNIIITRDGLILFIIISTILNLVTLWILSKFNNTDNFSKLNKDK